MRFIINKEDSDSLTDALGIPKEQEEAIMLKTLEFFNKYSIKLYKEKKVNKIEILEELENFSNAELGILLIGSVVFQLDTVVSKAMSKTDDSFARLFSDFLAKRK